MECVSFAVDTASRMGTTVDVHS